ncbi:MULTISPECIES: penicillin-binding transpeptidase domain-containing protein [Gammaproteobacteria]|uniref:penicillin-binding transpeptidase domain-containing protein n=1 Tax=Gammaproteobacteria TaxID=1236 RepID=UPI000DCFA1EC|nr:MULTISPECIES: penicillin-binding transpeptidase domain-containing protein [Gammaproteobacteria]RTE86323.1 peptidoglycan glycosyltransferase FtsI [Aliidiomarina sp. B3213]TCZ91673.1 peptidoglycan glycosyltransferase FtsI [Lysobacter sp. N42]
MAIKRNQKILRPEPMKGRFITILLCMGMVFFALVARAAYIQVIEPDRLRHEGDLRTVRVSEDRVQRGTISDRNGVELAVSVPVQTVWADPQRVHNEGGLNDMRRWEALAEVFNTPLEQLLGKVENPERRFVYLERMVTPAVARYVRELDIPGVSLKEESRRFYPTGEISAHLVGITNIDGTGLDGVEALYNEYLTGTAGQRTYRRDGQGRVIEELEVTEAQPPQSIELSIDQRIQTFAYRELKRAVGYHQATSGSVVIVDVNTSEVLAMANSPSYNPNNRSNLQPHQIRNRAIADAFEPGSTVKPLVIMQALASGEYDESSLIDTSPGWMTVGGRRVQDAKNEGVLTLGGVLARSSNVGTSQLALDLGIDELLENYYSVGFGNDTGTALFGEAMGQLRHRTRWSEHEIAALSYGYGLTTTSMQLAQMYTILGSGGLSRPLSILRREQPAEAVRVFPEDITERVVALMQEVTAEGGTGSRAQVPGYRVAGKTGTTRKAIAGGYGDEYVALFAGLIPANDPQLAIVVMINEPAGDSYHGGSVSAPVFSAIAEQATRILNIAPDAVEGSGVRVAGFSGGRSQ